MGVITFLITLGIVGLGFALVVGALSAGPAIMQGRGTKSELRSAKQKLRVAEGALRNIANSAGNPSLEAQIALDEINQLEMKELN